MAIRLFAKIWTMSIGIWLVACNSDLHSGPPDDVTIQQQVSHRINHYLVKDDSVRGMFSIDGHGITMLERSNDPDAAEFHLTWNEVEQFEQQILSLPPDEALGAYLGTSTPDSSFGHSQPDRAVPAKPPKDSLADLKIALDPGHVGGSMEMARLEGRFMKLREPSKSSEDHEVHFNEGNLTYATAALLREALEKRGTEVLITREGYGLSSFGYDFDHWKTHRYPSSLRAYAREKQLTPDELDWYHEQATDADILHSVFNWDDFRERARKINQFDPDLSLIIHFNADATDTSDHQGFFKSVDVEFNMAFVPGAFMDGELNDSQSRLAFLRLAVSDQLDNSLAFCDQVVTALVKETGVPAVTPDQNISYLASASLATRYAGVYARNLAMLRRLSGTVCYAEALYEDNVTEARRLAGQDLEVEGKQVSSRVADVARAYLDAITAHVAQLAGDAQTKR